MALTKEMQRRLAGRARAANRRLERATAGQRSYLEKQISHYHVRKRDTGMIVFQQGNAASEAEYRARMRELDAFMNAATSTRRGWDLIKRSQVEQAGPTIRGQGYDLTDDELAIIMEEIDDGHGNAAFYKALANVAIGKSVAREDFEAARERAADEARKAALESGKSDAEAEAAANAARDKIKFADYWTPDSDTITAALKEKRTAQERTEELLRKRKAKK